MLHEKRFNLVFLVVLFCSMMAFAGCSSSSDDSSNAAGSAVSISGTGIVWKPVSEANGNLAVVPPANYGNDAAAVLTADGTLVENGTLTGRSHGNRPVYRFNRSGRNFPTPCVLQIGTLYFSIPNPAQRYN